MVVAALQELRIWRWKGGERERYSELVCLKLAVTMICVVCYRAWLRLHVFVMSEMSCCARERVAGS